VTGGDPSGGEAAPRVVAFYLPQFHQVPENDAWHGPGFTEWSVVARTKPLFDGHDQPHLPGELGFYDLRVPETREAQARLARSHGISGFLYYHYWFRGKRMLDRPFDEVLASGRPDFPFALCWANESWYRRWQGSSDEMLVAQEYDEADDREHIRWLIEAFRDPRYIRVHGRPLLAIYRAQWLPDPKRTFDLWREECALAGVEAPWMVLFETGDHDRDPAERGFDASAEFVPHGMAELVRPIDSPQGVDPSHLFYDYETVAAAYSDRPDPPWVRYPCVATGWDNTPRRQNGEAMVLCGSTPDRYGEWLRRAVTSQTDRHGSDGIVFVNAWNEWAEGAHLEPDTRHGRRFLEVTRDVLSEARGVPAPRPGGPIEGLIPAAEGAAPVPVEDLYDALYQRFVRLQASASGMLAYGERRLAEAEARHRAELAESRAESQKLAAANLSLESRLAFEEERYKRLLQSIETNAGRPPLSPT